MKKRISILLAALTLALSLVVPASAADETMNCIFDLADVLTYEEWTELEERATELSVRHDCGVYAVLLDDYTSYGDGDVYDVTTQIYHSGELGLGDGRDGIIVLLSLADRDYAMFVYGDRAEDAFDSYGREQLEQAFLDDFGSDDWYTGLSDYLTAFDEYMTSAENGEPVRESSTLGIVCAIGVSILIALVVCLILKSRMKSVYTKVEANEYVAAGGLTLSESYDNYTHTTETRRPIETESTEDRSGGGGSGRSGKF